MLHLKMGDLCVLVYFGVSEGLAMHALLGTLFMDQCTRSIFPAEGKLVPLQSHPVALFYPQGQQDNATTAGDEPADESATDDVGPILIRAEKEAVV